MENLLNLNLEQILRAAVNESVGDLKQKSGEKDLQKQKTAELKPFRADDKKTKDEKARPNVDEEEDSTPVKKTKTSSEKAPDVDLNAIVELVGSIRAGRSLKDKGALKDLKMYFQQLNGTERMALFAFLTGISKIMRTPDTEEPPEIKTPDDAPYSVKMDRVIKAKTVKKSAKPKGEDSPIVVGEVADKSAIKKLLRRNR